MRCFSECRDPRRLRDSAGVVRRDAGVSPRVRRLVDLCRAVGGEDGHLGRDAHRRVQGEEAAALGSRPWPMKNALALRYRIFVESFAWIILRVMEDDPYLLRLIDLARGWRLPVLMQVSPLHLLSRLAPMILIQVRVLSFGLGADAGVRSASTCGGRQGSRGAGGARGEARG